jgi:peptidoglycan/LPS O-acetylase OafA/YrhL
MATPGMRSRSYFIDWLRVVAILAIFLFHSVRFFTFEDWHVSNAQRYLAAEVLMRFLASWGMPLIFVISGASTFYALERRGPGRFLRDRVLRLLVPLVIGVFTYSAWQVYLERITRGQFQGSFWAFLPHYFDGLYGFGGNFAWMGLHLWYLEMLFVFSLLCLPLLWWLERGTGARLMIRACRFLAKPGTVCLLAPPAMFAATAFDPATSIGTRAWGGWNLPAHLLFFLSGFVLVANEDLQQRIQRMRWLSLAAGALLVGILAALMLARGDPPYGTGAFILIGALLGVNAWCWILAIWGFAREHLSAGMPALGYANEGVLPFYILHQPVLLSIGYFVVPWSIPDPLKWAVIGLSSLAISVAAYALLIRRNRVLRVLFGMKPQAFHTPNGK